MYPESLQTYLKILFEHDQLHCVAESVDPDLEAAAIVDRICKGQASNKALLFEKVKGFSVPLAANLFGSLKRIECALQADSIDSLARRFRADLDMVGGQTSSLALSELVSTIDVSRQIESPEWQEVNLTDKGLHAIPALKNWPCDGGRYLTLGQVFTHAPDDPGINCGMYRIQVIDEHNALLRCYEGSGAEQHRKAWHRLGQAMPVAISLGGPPALTWAAGLSLPSSVAEIDFVKYLVNQELLLSRCLCSDLTVPATAEIVIEGLIAPGDEMLEGPFGNHTGYYAPPSLAPVIKISSIRMKSNAICLCTVVGPPPMESSYMAVAAGRILLQLLQYDHPWVCEVHMPVEGIYHRAAVVALSTQTKLTIEDIRDALTTSQLLKKSRLIILVDEDVDLQNMQQVYWKVVNNLNCVQALGGVIVDARASEGSLLVQHDPVVEAQVDAKWPKYDLY